MVSVVFVVGVSVPAVGGRGGKRGVKRGPPLPAGVEAPWDGGKRSVKERETETTPACGWEATGGRREAGCETGTAPACGWEAAVGRREAEHETETTPASQKTPVMDVSRQARAVSVSFGPRNGKTGAVSVSFGPQNSTTRAARVSYDAVGAAKRTGEGRHNGRTRPLGRPRAPPSPRGPITRHAHCPLDSLPTGTVSMKCHTHPECTRLSLLTEPPVRVRGALRS